MASPTFITTPDLVQDANQPTNSSPLTSATGSGKPPAIRVLAGPLRLTTYQPLPILLDASDRLVQESETEDAHIVTLVSPPAPQKNSTRLKTNGVRAWTCQIKGRFSAFAVRSIASVRRVLRNALSL